MGYMDYAPNGVEKLSEKSQTCSWRSLTGCREAPFGRFRPPHTSQIPAWSIARITFRTVSEEVFSEVTHLTWCPVAHTFLHGGVRYSCCVSRERGVRGRDSYPPLPEIWGSYPTNCRQAATSCRRSGPDVGLRVRPSQRGEGHGRTGRRESASRGG